MVRGVRIVGLAVAAGFDSDVDRLNEKHSTGGVRMRLARNVVSFALLSGLFLGVEARAGVVVFDTQSTATQMIYSPLFGGAVPLDAAGPQQFTIDTTTGAAYVTSAFQGSDFPNPYSPGQFFTYDLYNTVTTGTVITNPSGTYDISYSLLFELKLTSGPLAGLIFETLDNATFASSGIPTLPFPPGTAFSDPAGPANDSVNIYVKYDPTGTFAAGTLAGVSFDRLVTVNSIVPEPSSIVSGSLAAVICFYCGWRRSRVSRPRLRD